VPLSIMICVIALVACSSGSRPPPNAAAKQSVLGHAPAAPAPSATEASRSVVASARRKPRSYVNRVIDAPYTGPYSSLAIKPRTIHVGGSGAFSYRGLRWSSWGKRKAFGRGKLCSARYRSCGKTAITLSNRRRVGRRLVYTCLFNNREADFKTCSPPSAACGDIGTTGVGDIRAKNVTCPTARRVTRRWVRRSCSRCSMRGWRYRSRDCGYECAKIIARRGHGRVVFVAAV